MYRSFFNAKVRCAIALTVFVFLSFQVNGQISTPYPVYKVPAAYWSAGHPDSVMVFCGYPMELIAGLDDNTGPFTFEWSRYNASALSFDPVYTDTGATSLFTAPDEGGYRVHITNGNDIDTAFVVWVYEYTVEVNASIDYYQCGELALSGNAEAFPLIMYHPGSGDLLEVENDFVFEWTSKPSAPIPYPSENLSPVTYSPPYEDTWFYLTANDNFACKVTDSVFYVSIEVKADFTPEPLEGPAPLEVKFSNKSINASEFQWFFGEPDGFQGIPDDHSFEPVHVFNVPREYYIRLKAFSDAGCKDEFTYPDPVFVHYSMLEVPNVFTPDGDGINDVFIVKSRSLREFRGVIYNRNGQKLFEWTDPSEGWDGTTARGREVPPGVYYYIIKGRGWDGKEYEYTGALHLYRGR